MGAKFGRTGLPVTATNVVQAPTVRTTGVWCRRGWRPNNSSTSLAVSTVRTKEVRVAGLATRLVTGASTEKNEETEMLPRRIGLRNRVTDTGKAKQRRRSTRKGERLFSFWGCRGAAPVLKSRNSSQSGYWRISPQKEKASELVSKANQEVCLVLFSHAFRGCLGGSENFF